MSLKAQQIIRAKDDEIAALKSENAELRAKMQQLLHERYGKKSEKIPDEVLPELDEANVTPEETAVITEAEQAISVAAHTREKPKRKPKIMCQGWNDSRWLHGPC